MKTALIFCFILITGITVMAQTDTNNTTTEKDTSVKDPFSSEPILLGYANREAFKDTSYSWWFNSVYDMYDVDSTSADSLKNELNDVSVEIIMGTWCSDSRREVPKLFKILDYLKFPEDKVTLLMVGRDMKARADETEKLNLEKVPTIIFYRNDKEAGRIIESPQESLEKDMLKILKG